MKIKRIISAFLTLLMLLSSMVGVVDAAWADKVDEDGNPIINYTSFKYDSAAQKLADMVMVKEAYDYQLWYEEFTGEIAVVDKVTGQVTFSNPWDISSGYQNISTQIKQKLLSQIIITYLDNGQLKTMYSYNESALRGQIKKSNIKNGIRVEYTLGEENVIRLVPRIIRADRFEELILANITDDFARSKLEAIYTKKWKDDPLLTERSLAVMYAQYPITMEMDIYVCDERVAAKELRNAEATIKQYCPNYTYEELEIDHEITGYSGVDAAPPRFKLAVQYILTETGLDVRLAANSIEFDETAYQFQTVTLLPYFGAGSHKYKGYAVIPDGSGALIRYEDFIGQSVNISGSIYGADYAYHEITGQHSEVMRQPYFGLVTNYNTSAAIVDDTVLDTILNPPEVVEPDSSTTTTDGTEEVVPTTPTITPPAKTGEFTNGFLAVITEGDSLASLMAEVGGTTHPYTTVYPTFTPRPSDQYNLADSISVSGNAVWTVTSSRKYTDSYRIKYVFLRDDDLAAEAGVEDYYRADWIGMATAYRDYLTAKGDITKIENAEENIPLFIETFGSIGTTERKFSFPVSVEKPLTTFEDIKTMYNELTELGIGNVNFKLTGYANGGLEATVPYKLKWTDVVGGSEGFTDLAKYATEHNFDIYPEFDFAYLHKAEAFDGLDNKKHLVRTIDNRYTSKRSYNAATQSFDRSFALAISPSCYEYFYDTFGPNYLGYENDSISVSNLGTDLNSDFDEDDPYHREDNKGFTEDLLSKLDTDYANVMVEGGNAYAIKYADVILKASLTSSNYSKASESIPFFGMVYHGSKVFTGGATNMEGDINEAILHSIENGAGMYFILSYQNTSLLKENVKTSQYYSVAYDIWKSDIVKYYTVLNDAISDLQESYIIDHEFLDGERIPDPDELEADRLAEEEELRRKEEKEAKKREEEERNKRLEDRLNKQYGLVTEEDTEEEVVETPEVTPEEPEEEEEIPVVEEKEDYVVPDKYKTEIGTIVYVEYEGNVGFILNYNSFDVKVEYDGTEYTIAALNFVRLD